MVDDHCGNISQLDTLVIEQLAMENCHSQRVPHLEMFSCFHDPVNEMLPEASRTVSCDLPVGNWFPNTLSAFAWKLGAQFFGTSTDVGESATQEPICASLCF